MQLFFQNPAFGFQVVSLVAGRLIADRRRPSNQPASGTGEAVSDTSD